MLDDLLKNEEVSIFIDELKNNEKFYKKDMRNLTSHSFYVSSEIALYIFYDALLKYKIIIDDDYLFDEYIENLEKIYKIIDNFDGIIFGINKIICKMVALKLNIKDINNDLSKKEIISFIYNKYIVNGYLIHGYNTSYESNIKNEGFVPEFYVNYYQRFLDMIKIFEKYGIYNCITKDFTNNRVYFTDDVVMSCYFSNYSPMFFYNFLTNEEIFGKRVKKDAYLLDNYEDAVSGLKRFMNNASFSDSDKKVVLDLVNDQWKLLHKSDKKISLLLVKRRLVYNDENIKLSDYLDSDSDVCEIVDRLLSSKRNNVYYDEPIDSSDIKFVTFEPYYDVKKLESEDLEKELEKHQKNQINIEFLDKYGNVSLLLLVGSLFITLGVIISIFMVIRGI